MIAAMSKAQQVMERNVFIRIVARSLGTIVYLGLIFLVVSWPVYKLAQNPVMLIKLIARTLEVELPIGDEE